MSTNGVNPRLVSTEYTKTIDMDYGDYLLTDTNPLLEMNTDYQTYDITIEQTTFSLEKPAYFHMEETTDGNYTLDWKLTVGDEEVTLVNTAGTGSLQETAADGKPVVTASLSDLVSGASYELYVDAIFAIIVGVAAIVGAVAAVTAVGLQIADQAAPEPCTACGGDGLMKADCTTCGATGQLSCTRCGGDGVIDCANCEGLGSVPCPRCGGDGKVNCPWCQGYGCLACEESGWQFCPDCQGKGSIPCPACGGSGDIQCTVCKSSGNLGCPACGGNGWKLTSCPHCGGDGTR
jgi:hypothetical protein